MHPQGVLAGYPVVGLKATLVDGSYHPVDSSEMAFKTAASLAYKAGLPQANPVLLEPIGLRRSRYPDSLWAISSATSISAARRRIMGMNPGEKGQQIVEARFLWAIWQLCHRPAFHDPSRAALPSSLSGTRRPRPLPSRRSSRSTRQTRQKRNKSKMLLQSGVLQNTLQHPLTILPVANGRLRRVSSTRYRAFNAKRPQGRPFHAFSR
jgi:hypothetical protein